MKKTLFLFLFMLICLLGKAQPHRILSFYFTLNNGQALPVHNVYLSKCDTIMYHTCTTHQGIARFYLDEDDDFTNMFIVIRQDEDLVSRISLDRMLLYNGEISTPKIKVRVMENRLLTDGEKDRIQNDRNTTGASIKMINGFFEQELIEHFGFARWYFPSKLFLCPKESFYNYVRNEYQNGFELFELGDGIIDHHPNDHELDSIASLLAIKSSEYKNGLYSYYLMRLDEPVICNGFPYEVYRLSWINKDYLYIYDTYSMRIEIQEQDKAIMYVSYRYTSDCENSPLYCDVIPLEDYEIGKFNELMQLEDYWGMDFTIEADALDGPKGTFIFEMYKNDSYKVVFRNASQDSVLNKINDMLWKYTGLKRNRLYRSQRIE